VVGVYVWERRSGVHGGVFSDGPAKAVTPQPGTPGGGESSGGFVVADRGAKRGAPPLPLRGATISTIAAAAAAAPPPPPPPANAGGAARDVELGAGPGRAA
jgi:hypothetical protein